MGCNQSKEPKPLVDKDVDVKKDFKSVFTSPKTRREFNLLLKKRAGKNTDLQRSIHMFLHRKLRMFLHRNLHRFLHSLRRRSRLKKRFSLSQSFSSVNDDFVIALNVKQLYEFWFLSTFQLDQKPKVTHLF